MAETDEGAATAADEARRARQTVERNVDALRAILHSLGYREDLRVLEGFKGRYDEYRRLDDEILPLALENTNVKAQRLSFGPAREAADAFRTALDSRTEGTARQGIGGSADALAARARERAAPGSGAARAAHRRARSRGDGPGWRSK